MSNEQKNGLEGIAIIGMAGRFPGAESVAEFWRNLQAGVESISRFTPEQLANAGISPDDIADPDYVPARGVLPSPDHFDAGFFNMTPKEAELTDPQHRLLLETAWHTMEDAGYAPEQVDGSVSVYAGMSRNSYFLTNLYPHRHKMPIVETFPTEMGNEKDYLATRISYKLGLTGASVAVSTACSTSLVATYHACEALLAFQCDMALAGGISVKTPQEKGYLYEEGAIASPDGHCRPYDSAAQGTVFSNGMGMVLLKRLEEAVADGDHIYAVIRGIAINNDGASKVNFGAPSVDGQAEAIAMAQAMADIDPNTIGYVEGHGTATPLGDPIEVAALTQAFRHNGATGNSFAALGSVKSNLGHLDAAAGVAGLIKTALMVGKGKLVPSLRFNQPNPKFEIENTPFYVNTEAKDWVSPDFPRRAGVSAFGTGGTNAHAVLEQPPAVEPSGASRTAHLLTLSAKDETALGQMAANLAGFLSENPEANLADVAFTLNRGRQRLEYRHSLVANSIQTTIEQLQKAVKNETNSHKKRRVIFMFPGQGSQYVNMGRELYESEAVFRQAVDECAGILQSQLGMDIRAILYPDAENEVEATRHLKETAITQPAIFVVAYATAKLWMSWGVQPAGMIGHSVGEFVAATLAGVFSLADGLRLLAERGRLMGALPGGAMLAVSRDESEMLPLLNDDLAVAALNAPGKCVVSGEYGAVAALENELERLEIPCRQLHTSHAFHSPMMEPILAEFAGIASQISLNPPQIPFVSSPSGDWITAEQATDPNYWARHLREAVRFTDGRRKLAENLDDILLEVGPGNTLATLSKNPAYKARQQVVLSTFGHVSDEEKQGIAGILSTLGKLWQAGAVIDWTNFYADEFRHRLSLPLYPFQRQRFWIEGLGAPSPLLGRDASRPLGRSTLRPYVPEVVMEATRQAQILEAVNEVLYEVGGLDEGDIEPNATFMELGFDSLFLTQASTSFKRKFKTKITFRQLMEETPTPQSLADYLDGVLPAEAFQQVARGMGQVAGSRLQVASNAHSPLPVAGIEGLMQMQLQQMQQLMVAQLQVAAGTMGQSEIVNQKSKIENRKLQIVNRKSKIENQKSQIANRKSEEPTGKKKTFGPWKPFDKNEKTTLDERQQRFLAELIERYSQRTAKSKQMTQTYRHPYADPRTASGFKTAWKELVYPIVASRSKGSRLWDVDGNEYVDMQSGFGSSLFGHSPDFVTEAIQAQLAKGVHIGPQFDLAGIVAEGVCDLTGMDRVTFCNTGSESVMAAMRIARTVSGRNLIATFSGDYHGQFDEVLVRGVMRKNQPRTLPIAPGIPPESVENMLLLNHGDPDAFRILEERKDDIAAVLIETVQSRHPSLQPEQFLRELREWTTANDICLIFDEVITGFRLAPGGAQEWFGVKADMATYGKVIGGGMPIGVLAGDSKYMDALDGGHWQFGDDTFPEVGVTYFAGTFVRHPLTIAAANSVVNHLKTNPDLQEKLNGRADQFANELNNYFLDVNAPIFIENCGSMLHIKFLEASQFNPLFFYLMVEKGVHIMSNRAFFLTTAHSDEDLAFVTEMMKDTVAEMQNAGIFSAVVAGGDDNPLPFPLTADQRGLWLASQLSDEATCSYNEAFSLKLSGRVDAGTMRRAVKMGIQRHSAYRLAFADTGETQQVRNDVKIDVPLLDFSDDVNPAEAFEAFVARQALLPFNLNKPPLIRPHLVKLADEDYRLHFVAHHIITDGWSSGVLVADIRQIYGDLKAGNFGQLNPATSFAEYVSAHNELAQSEEGTENIAFWKKQLTPLPTPLQLPADRSRPGHKSFRGDAVKFEFDPQVIAGIKAAAKTQKTTLFNLMLSAFNAFLYRLSGQDDLIVGVPMAGQALHGMNDLIGFCVHFLPLRSQITPEMPFAEFVKNTQSEMLTARDYQPCALGDIIHAMNLKPDPSRTPITDIAFNLDRPIQPEPVAGMAMEIDLAAKKAVAWDIFFNLSDVGETLIADCEYNSDILEGETVAGWLELFQTMLGEIVANPATKMAELPLLSEAERRKILVEWNDTAHPYPDDTTLHEMFEAAVEKMPADTALVDGERLMSYAELNERANQLGHFLQANGVSAGSAVGVSMARSAEMIVAILGIVKAGGVYVPLDPNYPAERLAIYAEDAGIQLALTQAKFADRMPAFGGKVVKVDEDWEQIKTHSTENLPIATEPDSPLLIIFTSGSTGRPKGVIEHHRGVINRCNWQWESYPFADGEKMAQKTTLNFVDAIWEIWGALLGGAPLVLIPQEVVTDVPRFLDLLAKHEIRRIVLIPSLIRILLESYPDLASRVPKLKYWTFSGEPVSRGLAEKFYEVLPEAIALDFYGMSEATIDATWYDDRWGVPAENMPIGKPIHNMQVYILDERMQPVPVGIPGEIYVGGVGLSHGYVGRPELTAERFVENPFAGGRGQVASSRGQVAGGKIYRTGDLGKWLPDGFVAYLGRADHQVKIRGFRVELGEIEAVLRGHSAVDEALVLARGEDAGKYLTAYIVSPNPPTANDLRDLLWSQLPDYMLPAHFVFLDAFPLMPNGKVNRLALPEPQAIAPEEKRFVAPRNELEREIAGMWQAALGVNKVSVEDNFFDIGGHSLIAVQLFAKMREKYGMDFPLATLFSAPTVAKLSELVAENAGIPLHKSIRTNGTHPPEKIAPQISTLTQWSSLVLIQEGDGKNPFFCVHGGGGNVLNFRAIASHMGAEQTFYGLQAQGVDGIQEPLTSIPEMAKLYLSHIRQAQPKGPYKIGGYSGGGVVAFEMAQQLLAQGEEVAFLGMFDTFRPGLQARRLSMEEHLQKMRQQGIASYVSERSRDRLGMLAVGFRRRRHEDAEVTPHDLRVYKLFEAFEEAQSKYELAFYAGKMTMFFASDVWDIHSHIGKDKGWREWVAELEIVETPGDHDNFVTEPHVETLARLLWERVG